MEGKERFANALETLMESKRIDEIHVSELVKMTGLSKQTFYYHFNDKYDLMEYCLLRMTSITFDKMAPYYPFTQSCLDVYKLYRSKQLFLRNAFSSSDINGLTAVMRRCTLNTYIRYLEMQGVSLTDDMLFALDLFTIGAVEKTKEWVNDGMRIPDKKLVKLWLQSMPAQLSGYFK